MDEKTAFNHTVSSLSEAWNSPQLRNTFSSSTLPILDWYLSYARSPVEAIVNLVEHMAFTQFSSPVPDQEALCQAIIYLFKLWMASKPEFINGSVKLDSSLQARTFRMFGRFMPSILPEMQALFSRTNVDQEICDAIAEAVKFHFPERIGDSLAVVMSCPPAVRSIPPDIMPQVMVYALCTDRIALAERLLDECPQSLTYPILKALDSFLDYEGRTLLEEFRKFCRTNFDSNCSLTKPALEIFIANSLYRLKLSSTACPKFLAAIKTKLFKYFVRKTLNSSKPEMDMASFTDAVQELCEGDEGFQNQVIITFRALGHVDLAGSFGDYFREVNANASEAKRARHKPRNSDNASSSVSLPERFALVKPYVPHGNVYDAKLLQDDILFVDSAAIFGSSIDVIRHVDLMAVRVYWRRRLKLIHPNTARQICLLVIAIPHSVFIFDLQKLLGLHDRHIMSGFAELEKVMKSDRVAKIVFLPCSEERALKSGSVFSESFRYITNRIPIRALSKHIDPSLCISTKLSSAVRLWLRCKLPCFHRLTNWTRRPLSFDQMKFAATECHALLDIFFQMNEFCSQSQIDFEAAKNLTMKACWDTNISDTESEDDIDESDDEDEGDADDYRKSFRLPKGTGSAPASSSRTSSTSNEPVASSNQQRYFHKVPAAALEPFEMPPSLQQKKDKEESRKRRSRFDDTSQQQVGAKRINEMVRRSESVETMRKSIMFVVSSEFVNVALELTRLEFIVYVAAPERSSPEQLMTLAASRSYKRVIIATQEVVNKIKQKIAATPRYKVAHFVALTSEDDKRPWARRVVEPILKTAGLSSDEIACHYELRRFPIEGAPLVVHYPRACFAIKMMKELRAEGKFNFCPSPDFSGQPSELQLLQLGGSGLPNNGNRVLLISSKSAEIKLENRKGELRVLTVPRFERFYPPGGSKKQAVETKSGLTQQTAWVISELTAILPASALPTPKNKPPPLAPNPAVVGQPSSAPKRTSPVVAPEPSSLTIPPAPVVITTEVEETDVTKLDPVRPCQNPQSLSDVRFLFYTTNRQLVTLESYLSAVGFSTANLNTSTNSSSNALAMARRENRVLIVEDQFSLDQLASLGAQPGEAILLSAPDGRLLTQIRALADKFRVKDLFASLQTRSRFDAKHMEPPVRLFFFGDSLKCIKEFLSKIPAFFDIVSPDSLSLTEQQTTPKTPSGAFVLNLKGIVANKAIQSSSAGGIDTAAQSAVRLERILVADLTNCAYFANHEDVPHILLAPDRTLDLAKIFFNDIFKLPVQLLLPPFRPSSVDKLRYVVHSKQLIDFATYLKLAGLEVRLDALHKTFAEACALAKRENRFLISMSTRDTSNHLWSNPTAIPQRSVLLLTDDHAKPMPLMDLTKRIFDQVALRLTS